MLSVLGLSRRTSRNCKVSSALSTSTNSSSWTLPSWHYPWCLWLVNGLGSGWMVNKLALSPLSLQFRQVVFLLCQTTPFLTVLRLMPLTLRLELCSHRILMVFAAPSLSSLSHSQIWSGTTPCMTRSFLQLSLPSNSGLGTFWMWFPPLMLMTGYGFKDKTNTKPQPNKYKGVPESSLLAFMWLGDT